MYLRDSALGLANELTSLIDSLTAQAEKHPSAIMPGRTHMQHAQPVLLAHTLLAHAWPLVRDIERLRDWTSRAKLSPYGGGALAGNTLGLDAQGIAKELGFSGVETNSIDGTSSRDLVSEFAYIGAQIGIDTSRLAEDLIIWATTEFGFIRLHDSFSTGSSIMPQKKNPDIAELVRGKAGRLVGNLTGLLTTLKGLPLAYNRDLQEDKEPVFDTVDTLATTLPALAGMVSTLEFDVARMEVLAPAGFSLATDVAEWLVKQGIPFRDAHEITGELVKFCEANGLTLEQPSDEQYLAISEHLKPAVRKVLTAAGSVSARDGIGGTSPKRVSEQIVSLTDSVAKARKGW
jgi:argininosuccinate lyase